MAIAYNTYLIMLLFRGALGHQSLDTTARYARVDIEQLRQAALPWP
jgi:hypothetical protein